jgi:hypothetical protein
MAPTIPAKLLYVAVSTTYGKKVLEQTVNDTI